jgi:hypothetical protein
MDCRQPSFAGSVGAHGWWIAAVDHSEQRCLQGSLNGGVVAEFSPGQPLELGARPIVNQAPEVHGDDLVGCLQLSIRLGVEGGRHLQLDPR